MLLVDLLDDRCRFGILVLGLFQSGGDFVEGFGRDGIQGHIRPCNRLCRADHPEFELVTGEGKGRGPVAVSIVLGDFGQCIDADGDELLVLGGDFFAF